MALSYRIIEHFDLKYADKFDSCTIEDCLYYTIEQRNFICWREVKPSIVYNTIEDARNGIKQLRANELIIKNKKNSINEIKKLYPRVVYKELL